MFVEIHQHYFRNIYINTLIVPASQPYSSESEFIQSRGAPDAMEFKKRGPFSIVAVSSPDKMFIRSESQERQLILLKGK